MSNNEAPDYAQELMMKLYDPERDGYESGSEGDFPLEQRALERIAELEADRDALQAENVELKREIDAMIYDSDRLCDEITRLNRKISRIRAKQEIERGEASEDG